MGQGNCNRKRGIVFWFVRSCYGTRFLKMRADRCIVGSSVHARLNLSNSLLTSIHSCAVFAFFSPTHHFVNSFDKNLISSVLSFPPVSSYKSSICVSHQPSLRPLPPLPLQPQPALFRSELLQLPPMMRAWDFPPSIFYFWLYCQTSLLT